MAPTSAIREERSPVAVLMDLKAISEGEEDIRMDDYLNDKLQTAADFTNLESLIASVETQRIQLQDQLRDAKSKLTEARNAAAVHTDALLLQTKEFNTQQETINKSLAIITTSDAPDEAIQKFKVPIEKLRRLDLANYYIEMLQEVDTLTQEARQHLPHQPKEALKPYARLKELSISLKNLQGPADDAAGHLVTYVDKRATSLWDEMKQIMLNDFDDILKKMNWPTSSEVNSEKWTSCFQRLLDLQTPELLVSQEPIVLLPMAALTKTFVQQFKYHFMGSKPTNSNQHPDYFLEWVVSLISSRETFLFDNVGPILGAHFKDTKLVTSGIYVDPVGAFITALLPVLREKISTLLTTISREPSVMSSFLVSLMKFDDQLRQSFFYDGGDAKNGWKGLTWEFLETWFPRWLEIEKEFALQRYSDIIKSKDNGKIDYDSAGPKRTKPTYGALKVMDLVGNVTKQYQGLRKFAHKIRFLIDIQLAILDEYHNLLKGSLDTYMAITSTVGRTLHGVTKEQLAQLEGTGALESLCKVFGSSDHVIGKLHDWSNTIFFVDLWNELQARAKRTNVDDNLAGTMSYAEVKSSTSASVGSEEDGALFDETIAAFTARKDHSERLMVERMKHSLPGALSAYKSRPQWLPMDNSSDAGTTSLSNKAHVIVTDFIDQSVLSITSEFEQPLQILNRDISFLQKALGTAPFRRVIYEVLDVLQDILWNDVLMREKFTRLGAAQFSRDISAVGALVDQYVANGSSTALGMPKLKEAVVLLALPDVKQDNVMSFDDAFSRSFTDNAEAKKVLEELGLEVITHVEARHVLDRRHQT